MVEAKVTEGYWKLDYATKIERCHDANFMSSLASPGYHHDIL